jgi:hypothetical protein
MQQTGALRFMQLAIVDFMPLVDGLKVHAKLD